MSSRRIIVVATVLAATAGWWLWKRESPAAPAAVGAVAVANQARAPDAPADAPAVAAATTVPVTTQVTGTLNFSQTDGAREKLELKVGGGLALWDADSHRLRVLLMDEPLSPAEEQQMLGYLRDERLADSGRPFGLLELQFRPGASTPDRGSLTSASLTVAAAGGLLHDSADVLSSIQLNGGTPPLEISTAGSARSAGANAWQRQWQLSVSIPVVHNAAR